MAKTKISQKDFDRKIKIWGTIIPILVAIISSSSTIFVAYYSSRSRLEPQPPAVVEPRLQSHSDDATAAAPASRVSQSRSKSDSEPTVDHKMSPADQIAVNKLSKKIDLLTEQYYKAIKNTEKIELDITKLAEEEAAIIKRYDPNYDSKSSARTSPRSAYDDDLKPKHERPKSSPNVSFVSSLVAGFILIATIALASFFVSSYLTKRILLARFEVAPNLGL
jgi:hypothetical protein